MKKIKGIEIVENCGLKYSFQALMERAEKAKLNALKAKENKSFWAFAFWWSVGEKLTDKAMNMKIKDAEFIEIPTGCVVRGI